MGESQSSAGVRLRLRNGIAGSNHDCHVTMIHELEQKPQTPGHFHMPHQLGQSGSLGSAEQRRRTVFGDVASMSVFDSDRL
jgi:hypothetical protein